MPADCVVDSALIGTGIVVGGRVFVAQRQNSAGGQTSERRIDDAVNQPFDVVWKDLMIDNKPTRVYYYVHCLSFFWKGHPFPDLPMVRYFHICFPLWIKMKTANSQFSPNKASRFLFTTHSSCSYNRIKMMSTVRKHFSARIKSNQIQGLNLLFPFTPHQAQCGPTVKRAVDSSTGQKLSRCLKCLMQMPLSGLDGDPPYDICPGITGLIPDWFHTYINFEHHIKVDVNAACMSSAACKSIAKRKTGQFTCP